MSKSERIPCEVCGAEILHRTAADNAGICKPCANDVRFLVYAAKERKLQSAIARLDAASRRELWLDPTMKAMLMARVEEAMADYIAPFYPKANFDGTILLWNLNPDYPERLIAEYVRDASPDRFLFTRCELIEDTGQSPVFVVRAKMRSVARRSLIENNALVPLVGTELRQLLVDVAGAHVQFVDAVVKFTDGNSDRYSIVNVVSQSKFIDHSLSDYSLIPGTDSIIGFNRFVSCGVKNPQFAIAREEEYRGLLYVSRPLGLAIREAGFKDVGLSTPASYYDYDHMEA